MSVWLHFVLTTRDICKAGEQVARRDTGNKGVY